MYKSKDYEWINFLKTLAMIAVIINHTHGIIYSNVLISSYSIFSVSMFVLIGGITAGVSLSRKSEVNFNYIKRRVTGILIPYFFASIVYCLYQSRGYLNITVLINHLVHFTASPPMYYIAFYIQLILVSTLLYKLIKKRYNSILIIFILGIIYFISVYFTKYTVSETMVLAARNLFGGTFLFVFALGIFFYMWMDKLAAKKYSILILIICLLGISFFVYKKYILISWANPPVNTTIVYTLLIFGIVFGFFNIFPNRNKYIGIFLNVFTYIGKNSLYVFLYHMLFIDLASKYNIFLRLGINNMFINAGWILACSIVPPLLIAYISNRYIISNLKYLFTNNNGIQDNTNS